MGIKKGVKENEVAKKGCIRRTENRYLNENKHVRQRDTQLVKYYGNSSLEIESMGIEMRQRSKMS